MSGLDARRYPIDASRAEGDMRVGETRTINGIRLRKTGREAEPTWVTVDETAPIAIPEVAFSVAVRAGYCRYNGASVPGVFQPLIGRPMETEFVRAALVHDYLYDLPSQRRGVSYNDKTPVEKREIDLAFYELLRQDGVGSVKASMMWWAVDSFGEACCRANEDADDAFDPAYLPRAAAAAPANRAAARMVRRISADVDDADAEEAVLEASASAGAVDLDTNLFMPRAIIEGLADEAVVAAQRRVVLDKWNAMLAGSSDVRASWERAKQELENPSESAKELAKLIQPALFGDLDLAAPLGTDGRPRPRPLATELVAGLESLRL